MGCCLSSRDGSVSSSSSSSALVVSATGDLRPFSTPVLVSDILQMDPSFFICNSDTLCYDEYIKPMELDDELDGGQIYFVLPVSKLRNRLSASEMAALAVKASVALNGKTMKNNKSKVMPFAVMESNVIVDEEVRLFRKQQSGLGVSKSGSIRKMHRYSSRKQRFAVPSFKLRLSTIYEDRSHKYSNNVV
ncbi:hypothetical protein QVD17_24170 [Tagetes erecta]|uniref:Uncharacterized protein n=1 Tax=Tagetes erecta TaxID=13708 RepID=A0AAD8NMM7_TARER|nr:hypothetical protein QVD17_24170 [Tagetes erecta]